MQLVPPDEIEGIVGAQRHSWQHLGRAVSADEQVYILHSTECIKHGVDLRLCRFSLAMDKHGIDATWMIDLTDRPVVLSIENDRLFARPA